MSNHEQTCKRLGFALAVALLFLTPSTKTEADPLPLPVLETVKSGAISVDSNGRLSIVRAAADAVIEQAATEFISLMAKGDATAIKSLLKRYLTVTPTIRDVLARLGPTPPLQHPAYLTADRLSR
jgi:hypothetical protein